MKKYKFFNIAAPKQGEENDKFLQLASFMLRNLGEGYKIISAAATHDSIQYVLEKEEENP